MDRRRSSTLPTIRTSFGATRIGARCLAEARERLVPITRRRLHPALRGWRPTGAPPRRCGGMSMREARIAPSARVSVSEPGPRRHGGQPTRRAGRAGRRRPTGWIAPSPLRRRTPGGWPTSPGYCRRGQAASVAGAARRFTRPRARPHRAHSGSARRRAASPPSAGPGPRVGCLACPARRAARTRPRRPPERAPSSLEAEPPSPRRFRSQAEARMAASSTLEALHDPVRRHPAPGRRSPLQPEKNHAKTAQTTPTDQDPTPSTRSGRSRFPPPRIASTASSAPCCSKPTMTGRPSTAPGRSMAWA